MLRACRKGDAAEIEDLEPGEFQILLDAFGWKGGSSEARKAAVPVVAKYQAEGSSRWFACDCRPDKASPPILVPVGGSHVKRHQTDDRPPHADGCDFFRDPSEQRKTVRSHKRRKSSSAFRLLKAFKDDDEERPARKTRYASNFKSRSGIATMLAELVTRAGLQTWNADGSRMKFGDQFRALRNAAGSLMLDENVRVSDSLCTFADQFESFKAGLVDSPLNWTRARPHGIFILPVVAVSDGALVTDTQSYPVRGRIAVFGEPDGDRRPPSTGARDARSPYLAIAVVGQAVPDGDIELVRAYVHPCLAKRDMMLVDSEMERQTLDELGTLRRWLATNKGIGVTIEKPLFDIGPEADDQDEDADDGGNGSHEPPLAREVCIPDFIIRSEPVGELGAPTVIVETMGFPNPEYRDRKVGIHRLMSDAIGGVPVVLHDFHFPEKLDQGTRNKKFWRELR